MSDQPVLLTNVEEKIFDLDVKTVSRAIKSGDDAVIVDHVRMLRRQGQVNGLSLAHTLYLWKTNAGRFGDANDWLDKVEAETGLSLQTIRKYTEMWAAIFEEGKVDPAIAAALRGQPIGNLLLITPAAKEGQLDEEKWTRLAEATSKDEVRDVIRETRGEQTSSSSSLTIRLRRDGVLEAKKGKDPFVGIGYLGVDNRDNPTIDAAISRIIRAAGVIEQ